MRHRVFISYSRGASRATAEALFTELNQWAPGSAFIDFQDLTHGEEFPQRILDAELGAELVVVFAEPAYFHRWYCLVEFGIALEPLRRAYEPPRAAEELRRIAAESIVIALPADGNHDAVVDRLPPDLRVTGWPASTETPLLAQLVKNRLASRRATVGDQIARVSTLEEVRRRFLDLTWLPAPRRLDDVLVAPREAPRPSLQDDFVGRADDLWRIHHALTGIPGAANHSAALTTSIEGGAGFGKTQLAAEYLHRFGARCFSGGLFWVNAELPVEPQHYQMLEALDPAVPPLGVLQQKPGAVASRLSECLRKRPGAVLFVVDNVPEAPRDAPPLPLVTWCPALADVSLLVTSRRLVSLEPGHAVAAIHIDVLELEPAIAMLQRRVTFPNHVPKQHWIDIAEAVGRLPLALAVLNAAMAAGAISVSHVHKHIIRDAVVPVLDAAAAALEGKVPAESVVRVSHAFQLSFDLLSDDERAALRLLAQLAPEPIPEVVLHGEQFSPSVRAGLILRSFVMRVPGREVHYFGQVHRLIVDFVRAREGVERIDVSIARCLMSALEAHDPQDPLHWPLLSALVVHAEHLIQQCGALQASDLEPEFFALSNGAVQVLLAQGQLRRAEELSRRTVALQSQVEASSAHPGVVRAMYNLGWTLHDLGDLAEARRIKETVLELRARTLPADDSDIAAALQTLGWTLFEQGELRQAKHRHTAALAIFVRRFGPTHPDVLWAKHSLGWTLLEWGELATALELFAEVRDVRASALGPDRPETLLAEHSLAWVLHEQGKWAQAHDIHVSVLHRRREVLGEWHPDTIHTMHNLAENLTSLGELDAAIEMIQVVLAARTRLLREDHFDTLFTEHALANALALKEDFAQARALLDRVYQTRLRHSGEAHQETLRVAQTLAWTAFHQGQREYATTVLGRVIDVRRAVFPPRHPWTVRSLFDLALFYRELGDLVRASELLETVLRDAEVSLPDHAVLRRSHELLNLLNGQGA